MIRKHISSIMRTQVTLVALAMMWLAPAIAQAPVIAPDSLVDVVELRDGSRLVGRIERWAYDRGLEIVLITGAKVSIPKHDIRSVTQQTALADQMAIFQTYGYGIKAKPVYAFREKGLYQSFSVFLNTSTSGGAGMHYAIGHRFNRWIGAGLGVGYESNDLTQSRQLIPVYAEARGFLLARRITPYYGLKMGYAFALTDEEWGLTSAKGGFGFSPELGVRFGSRAVNVYAGVEYKWQQASWTYTDWGWDGQGTYTDDVTYKRFNFRTGILF
jgi:hypothetical protein